MVSLMKFTERKVVKSLVLTLMLFAVGCSAKTMVEMNPQIVPPNAVNIKSLSHYWISFEVDGQLYYMSSASNDRVCFPVKGDCKCK